MFKLKTALLALCITLSVLPSSHSSTLSSSPHLQGFAGFLTHLQNKPLTIVAALKTSLESYFAGQPEKANKQLQLVLFNLSGARNQYQGQQYGEQLQHVLEFSQKGLIAIHARNDDDVARWINVAIKALVPPLHRLELKGVFPQ